MSARQNVYVFRHDKTAATVLFAMKNPPPPPPPLAHAHAHAISLAYNGRELRRNNNG